MVVIEELLATADIRVLEEEARAEATNARVVGLAKSWSRFKRLT